MDRKISVRATRDELIERGILLPDVASVGQSTSVSSNMPLQLSRLPQHSNNFSPSEDPIHGKQKITCPSWYNVMSIMVVAFFCVKNLLFVLIEKGERYECLFSMKCQNRS